MSLIIAIALVLALSAQSEAPQTKLWSDPEVFRCGPSLVRPDDTLVLSKRSSALRELAVLRPGASVPHELVVAAVWGSSSMGVRFTFSAITHEAELAVKASDSVFPWLVKQTPFLT